jgi:predicted acyltransferase (DUF342 family)
MSNSWKQYGGIYKTDRFQKFSVGTLVADEILLRQKYSGEFEVLGALNVAGDILGQAGLIIRQNDILRFDLSTNLFIDMDTYISKLFLGTNTTDYMTAYGDGMGVNLTQGTPAYGTFEIIGRTGVEHSLVASSPNITASSVLARNVNDKGIRVFVNDTNSAIEFYNDDTITDKNSEGKANASIQYTSNNGGQLSFITPSLIFGDTIHTDYLPFIYNDESVKTGTSLNLVSNFDASANTKFFITSNDEKGLGIVGGSFPYDSTKSFGAIGLQDNNFIFEPYVNVVNTNNLYKNKITMGINTHDPNENYNLNINGKVLIQNGQINELNSITIEPQRWIKQGQNIYLSGSPDNFTVDGNNNFTFNTYYSSDNGVSWNTSFPNNSITGSETFLSQTNSIISRNTPYIHSSGSFTIIGTNDIYLYITNTITNPTKWRRINVQLFDPTITTTGYNDIDFIETVFVGSNIILIYKNKLNNGFYLQCSDTNGNVGETLTEVFLNDSISTNYNFGYSQIQTDIYTVTLPSVINYSKPSGNFLFIVGNDGIYRYTNNSFGTSNPSHTIHNNSITYYSVDYINSNIIAVGSNIISYSSDNGSNWTDITVSGISGISGTPNLHGIHIESENEIYVVGEGVFMYFKNANISNITDPTSWTVINEYILNAGGNASTILTSDCILKDVYKIDDENFVLTRLFQSYIYDEVTPSNNQQGKVNSYYVYIPSLFNNETNTVIDICGNMNVYGTINIKSLLRVDGDVSMNSKLFVDDDVSMNSKVFVGGDVSLNSKLFVDDDVSMNSNVFVGGDVSLNSKVFVGGDVSLNSKLFVDDDVSMNSNVFVGGDVSLNSKLFVDDDVSMNSKVFVDDDVSLNSKVFVGGDVSMNSKVFVGGDVSIEFESICRRRCLIELETF